MVQKKKTGKKSERLAIRISPDLRKLIVNYCKSQELDLTEVATHAIRNRIAYDPGVEYPGSKRTGRSRQGKRRTGEKTARFEIRISSNLGNALRAYCIRHETDITELVTFALRNRVNGPK